jgi:hypothetical protein
MGAQLFFLGPVVSCASSVFRSTPRREGSYNISQIPAGATQTRHLCYFNPLGVAIEQQLVINVVVALDALFVSFKTTEMLGNVCFINDTVLMDYFPKRCKEKARGSQAVLHIREILKRLRYNNGSFSSMVGTHRLG